MVNNFYFYVFRTYIYLPLQVFWRNTTPTTVRPAVDDWKFVTRFCSRETQLRLFVVADRTWFPFLSLLRTTQRRICGISALIIRNSSWKFFELGSQGHFLVYIFLSSCFPNFFISTLFWRILVTTTIMKLLVPLDIQQLKRKVISLSEKIFILSQTLTSRIWYFDTTNKIPVAKRKIENACRLLKSCVSIF